MRVIDAASVGVPSIVGKVSDMGEVVQNGQTGRVLGDGARWASALTEMALDRQKTREMGERARLDLETRWSARLDAPVIDPELIRWVMA